MSIAPVDLLKGQVNQKNVYFLILQHVCYNVNVNYISTIYLYFDLLWLEKLKGLFIYRLHKTLIHLMPLMFKGILDLPPAAFQLAH